MRVMPVRASADSRVRLSPALIVYSWQLLLVGSGVKGMVSAVIVDAAAHNRIRAHADSLLWLHQAIEKRTCMSARIDGS
jgi:hypothetical protein